MTNNFKKKEGKYYYPNLLSKQFITAKPNIAWASDITYFELRGNERLAIFLCIDLHTNVVLSYSVNKQDTKTRTIIRKLSQLLNERFLTIPETKLILHTDRGSQFTSQSYNNFTVKYKEILNPSMSKQANPKDNAVIERLNRTLKGHRINEKTLQDALDTQLNNDPNFNGFRKLVGIYIKSLNRTPNKKSMPSTPEQHDYNVDSASLLMTKPRHPVAHSEIVAEDDHRRADIEQFKKENSQVVNIIEEIASADAELVNLTPFDLSSLTYEDNLKIRQLRNRIMSIYDLIKSNPQKTKEYVTEAIEESPRMEGIEDSLQEVQKGIKEIKDILQPKKPKKTQIQPLRDPLSVNLLPTFLSYAGDSFVYQKDLRRSQLRITYTILFHVGLRLNEIQMLTRKEIIDAIQTSKFNLVHYKTKEPHIHLLSDQAILDLKRLDLEYQIVFDKYKFNYLFGKYKPINRKSLITVINRDLKHTCKITNMPYNIKSHSFRINKISSLLKYTTIQNTAEIIGHKDIKSTMSYKRYALTRNEIKELLNQIDKEEA